MPLNTGAKRWVSVPHAGGTYVYRTNVPSSVENDLGITAFDPQTEKTGAYYEANSPKPPRAAKERTISGIDSSFCDKTKISTLRQNSWKISKEYRRRRIYKAAAGKKLITVYATTAGVKYAWDMPRDQYQIFQAELTGLGIEEAKDSDIPTLVFGCSVPRPARVQKTVINGSDVTVYETFCSDTKRDSLPSDYVLAEDRIIFGPDYVGG